MAQHKWHKEIKAWADGAEIEWRYFLYDAEWTKWISINKPPSNWDFKLKGDYVFDGDFSSFNDKFELRIKPQPKEPQYLYVYKRINGTGESYSFESTANQSNPHWTYIGKIKLEDIE